MNPSDLANIKRLIWVYFWLLLFEGALRKWVAPSLASPLLIIRAPVLLALYGYAFSTGKFPMNGWISSLLPLSVLCLLAGFVVVAKNPLVAVYGWQADFLHLPLMFVMGRFLAMDDVAKFGKWILRISVPMAMLVVLQFRSGPGSFVNRGAGENAMQITVDVGRVRPAGTFSYNLGVSYLFALVTAFVLYQIITKRYYPTWLTLVAGFATLLAAACSGSRTCLASIALVALSLGVIMFVRPQLTASIMKVALAGAAAVALLGTMSFVKEGVDIMQTRLERASKNEGGLMGFLARAAQVKTKEKAGETNPDTPLLGFGLGVGTSAGASMLYGTAKFALAEEEWQRVWMESGPVLGVLFIAWRALLVVWIGMLCVRLAARGHILPMLLFAACGFIILKGQYGQPTVMGFAAFGGGLCLASMRLHPAADLQGPDDDNGDDSEESQEEPERVLLGSRDRMVW